MSRVGPAWRLRLVVYGLLAVATALVVGARDWGQEEFLDLHGRTSDGYRIRMVVSDGRLRSFDTHVSVRCPGGESYHWRWYPGDGNPVPFHHNGSRSYVRERSEFRNENPPITLLGVMRGELNESGKVAQGTIDSHEVRYTRADAITCEGRATFSARVPD